MHFANHILFFLEFGRFWSWFFHDRWWLPMGHGLRNRCTSNDEVHAEATLVLPLMVANTFARRCGVKKRMVGWNVGFSSSWFVFVPSTTQWQLVKVVSGWDPWLNFCDGWWFRNPALLVQVLGGNLGGVFLGESGWIWKLKHANP